MLYSELYTIINDTIQSNDEPTFIDHIPDFVRMAEEAILREVQLQVATKTVRGSATAGNEYLTVPSDYIAPLWVSVMVDDAYYFLLQKDSSYLLSAYPSAAVSDRGRPELYSADDESKLRLRPIPDENYTIEMEYSHKPTSLVDVDSDATTWISTNMRAALTYASLYHAANYIRDFDGAMKYNEQFRDAAGLTKKEQEGRARTDRRRREYPRGEFGEE